MKRVEEECRISNAQGAERHRQALAQRAVNAAGPAHGIQNARPMRGRREIRVSFQFVEGPWSRFCSTAAIQDLELKVKVPSHSGESNSGESRRKVAFLQLLEHHLLTEDEPRTSVFGHMIIGCFLSLLANQSAFWDNHRIRVTAILCDEDGGILGAEVGANRGPGRASRVEIIDA